MSRRIDVELTSRREDGSFTWRAAGAREPRGTTAADKLPGEAKVGDVLRVEVDLFVDGIEIIAVIPSKAARVEPQRLQLLAPSADRPLVTSTLATRARGERPPRRDGERSNRGDRPPRRDGAHDLRGRFAGWRRVGLDPG